MTVGVPLALVTIIVTGKENCHSGGSHGLVVMGGYSHSEGCGFESRRCILDGNDIFHNDLF